MEDAQFQSTIPKSSKSLMKYFLSGIVVTIIVIIEIFVYTRGVPVHVLLATTSTINTTIAQATNIITTANTTTSTTSLTSTSSSTIVTTVANTQNLSMKGYANYTFPNYTSDGVYINASGTPDRCLSSGLNPCSVPVGIGAFGTVNNDGLPEHYNISTTKIRGLVDIYALNGQSDAGTVNAPILLQQGVPDHNVGSLQLNALLSLRPITPGSYGISLQDVVEFVNTSNTPSLWFDTLPSDIDSLLQNPNVTSFTCVHEKNELGMNCSKGDNIELMNYTYPLSINMTISVNPTPINDVVIVNYTNILCSIPCIKNKSFSVSYLNSVPIEVNYTITSVAIDSEPTEPYSLYKGTELVWGGSGGGYFSNFSSMSSSLNLSYDNGNGWQVYPYTYDFGELTSETATNLHVIPYNQGVVITIGKSNPGSFIYS
jgi:hypothetical protein